MLQGGLPCLKWVGLKTRVLVSSLIQQTVHMAALQEQMIYTMNRQSQVQALK